MVIASLRSVGRRKRSFQKPGQKPKGQGHTQTRKQKKDVKKGTNKTASHGKEKDEKKAPRSERHRKEKKSEDKKEEKNVQKSRVVKSEMRDRDRERTKEEKEQTSESDPNRDPKKANPRHPMNVSLKPADVDETDVTKLLEKLRVKKAQNLTFKKVEVISEKDKILLDRVSKKKVYKYSKKNPLTLLAQEDDADFFKKPTPKKSPSARAANTESPVHGSSIRNAPVPPTATPPPVVTPVEDNYDHVPKLADILKMPEKNVYTVLAVPYWAVNLEPDDDDMKDVEPPISVGSDHVEMMQKKQIILKVPKNVKLVLDEYQPMSELAKRDESNFHTHLVFSNTVRSLVNVNSKVKTEKKKEFGEEPTQVEENVSWSTDPIPQYVYDRDKPIASAREKVLVNDSSANPSPQLGPFSSNTTLSTIPSSTTLSNDKESP